MSKPPDYYDLLQVSPDAEAEIIQAAHKRLVDKWHTDRRPGDSSAFERLALLDEANAVLSDPARREEYDLRRRQPVTTGATNKNPGPSATTRHPEHFGTAANVSPAAWVLFAVGGGLFLIGQRTSPVDFLLRILFWGILFGTPAYFFLRRRQHSRLTVVAVVFLVAAGLDVAVGFYNRDSRHTQIDFPEPRNETRQPAPEKTRPLTPAQEPSKEAVVYFNAGLAATRRQDYEKAIENLNEAIRLDPDNGQAHHERAKVWHHKRELNEAIEDFNTVIRLDPKNGEAFRGRGMVWNQTPQLTGIENAIQDFTEAIRLNREDHEAYLRRGDSWMSEGDYDRAIRDFDEAIRLNQTYAPAYASRANAWRDKKDYDKAIRDYDTAIRLDPKSAFYYFDRGRMWAEQHNDGKALTDFNAAIRLDPCETLHVARGDIWMRKMQLDEAIRDYDEAIRHYARFGEAYRKRGRALYFKELDDRAIKDLDEAIRLNPKDLQAHYWRASAWKRTKDYDKAIQDLDVAIRFNPRDMKPTVRAAGPGGVKGNTTRRFRTSRKPSDSIQRVSHPLHFGILPSCSPPAPTKRSGMADERSSWQRGRVTCQGGATASSWIRWRRLTPRTANSAKLCVSRRRR
jgi:tetratricopeptide (TPR) repeat protein